MGERRPSYGDRDRSAGEPGKYWRPPRSHGSSDHSVQDLKENYRYQCSLQFYKDADTIADFAKKEQYFSEILNDSSNIFKPWGGNFSVPLWEKKFCTDACAIPWGKLCETKRLMSLYKNVVDWDDSAALEAFKDAKARFCAVYHGQPCDIPLPDPNMYIDMVNPDEHVDPELVADLEKSRCAVPKRDNAAPDGWDSFIFTDKPVPATGWGDGETSNTLGQQCSVNWDNFVKQPIEANCKQSSVNWDNYVSQPAQTIVQQSSGNWGKYEEQQGQTSSWGAPTMPCTANWDMKGDSLDAWKRDSGWGSSAVQTESWDNGRDSYYVSDSQGGSYGHWRMRNNESGRRNSRNRDRGGPISSKAMKSKYHADEHSGANNGWRHCRARNNMHYSYEKPGYANQSLAM